MLSPVPTARTLCQNEANVKFPGSCMQSCLGCADNVGKDTLALGQQLPLPACASAALPRRLHLILHLTPVCATADLACLCKC